jgi:autotransporter-associated beta strand protein
MYNRVKLVRLIAGFLVANAFVFLLSAPAALAGVMWDGGGANDNIDTRENWNANELPDLAGSTAELVFAGNVRLTPLINADVRPLGLRFDSLAGAFVIGGTNTITTGTTGTTNGNIVNDSPLTQTIGAPVMMRRGALDASAGDLVIGGAINVGGGSSASGRSLTILGEHDVFLSGPIEGTGTSASAGGVITKNSTGLLHISSNSPLWAGRIGIDVGVLRISAPDALGDPNSRTLVQGGGATGKSRLELSGGVSFAPERLELTGRDIGSAPVHLSNFAGNNTWTGNAVLRTGGAEYGFESAAGTLTITGNVVNETGNATPRTIRFAGSGGGEFAGLFLDGTGTGPLSIRKEGAGTWTVTNTSFGYAGDTLITGGTLAFAPGISIDNSPDVEIAAGAVLDIAMEGLDRVVGQTLTGAGTVLGHVNLFGGTLVPDAPALPDSAATLALGSGLTLSGGTVHFDLANTTTIGGGVNDLIAIAGNLSLSAPTSIAINPLSGEISNGAYRLFNYSGTLAGNVTNLLVDFPPTRQTTAIDASTLGQVNLVVSGSAASLVWNGDGSFNLWDVGASANWLNGAAFDTFFNLDQVTFDDTAAPTSRIVDVSSTVIPRSVIVDTALAYTFTGTGKISGVTGLTKNGVGKLTVATNNDNSGRTTINAGTLQVGAGANSGSLGSGEIVNHGVLIFNRSTGLVVPGAISGNGSLEKQGSGTITLAANNSYTGTTTISSGTLQIGAGGPTGAIGPGEVTNNGLLVVDRSTDLVLPNLISGSGGLDKRGEGFVELTGLNSYSGPTTINGASSQGGLVVDNLANGGLASDLGAATADAANLHIRTNGTLRYVGPAAVTDRLFTIGNARIDASGAGPVAFTNSGALGTSGGNRTLTLLGSNTQANTLVSSIVDSGPTGVTSLAKQGDGTWVLSGVNSFSGATTISAGVLRLSSTTALGATDPLPGNTNAAGTTIVGDVGGSGQLVLSGGITLAPEPLTLQARQGPTANVPHLVNAGGDNRWTGPITLTTGGFEYTLRSDAGTLMIDNVIAQSATTLERFLNLEGSGDGVVVGAILNGGGSQIQSLRKRGPGTWTLNGANTYLGTTTIEAGTLRISPSGSIATNNSVTTAAGATFAVDGAATITQLSGAGSTRVGEQAGPAALTADRVGQALLVIGRGSRATLNAGGGTSVVGELMIPAGGPAVPGTLDINDNKVIVNYAEFGTNPEAVLRMRIIDGRGAVGLGATWTGPGMTSGTAAADVLTEPESRSVGYADNAALPLGPYTVFGGEVVDESSVLIAYTRTGDANLDGIVNDDDVTIVGATYAPGVPQPAWALGDFDYNGFVDDDDVTLLGVFYDPAAEPLNEVATTSIVRSVSAPVPEPSTFMLSTLVAFTLAIAAAAQLRRCPSQLETWNPKPETTN